MPEVGPKRDAYVVQVGADGFRLLDALARSDHLITAREQHGIDLAGPPTSEPELAEPRRRSVQRCRLRGGLGPAKGALPRGHGERRLVQGREAPGTARHGPRPAQGCRLQGMRVPQPLHADPVAKAGPSGRGPAAAGARRTGCGQGAGGHGRGPPPRPSTSTASQHGSAAGPSHPPARHASPPSPRSQEFATRSTARTARTIMARKWQPALSADGRRYTCAAGGCLEADRH